MVTVTGVVWLIAPDVPVTIKVTWDVDVWAFALFELLPHPRENIEMTSSRPRALVHRMLLLESGFRLRVVRTVPNTPRPGSSRDAMPDKLYPVTGGGVDVAAIVNVEDAALAPGEIVAGLKVQLRPAGAVQESVI